MTYLITLYQDGTPVHSASYPDEMARANDALRLAREWADAADQWDFTKEIAK